MTRTILFLLFALTGLVVLVWLGVWQLQRLEWKQGVLADIGSRIAAPPVALPEKADAETDKYLPVEMTGQFGAGVLRVLVSQKLVGAGYRLITPFEIGERTVLVDRGFIPVAADNFSKALVVILDRLKFVLENGVVDLLTIDDISHVRMVA